MVREWCGEGVVWWRSYVVKEWCGEGVVCLRSSVVAVTQRRTYVYPCAGPYSQHKVVLHHDVVNKVM